MIERLHREIELEIERVCKIVLKPSNVIPLLLF
jgi:hypothetical protein